MYYMLKYMMHASINMQNGLKLLGARTNLCASKPGEENGVSTLKQKKPFWGHGVMAACSNKSVKMHV